MGQGHRGQGHAGRRAQSYHAYLGAYAYGNQADTDYVQVEVTDMAGNRLLFEVWDGVKAPEEVA